jgi:glutamate/aspartate transport system substrate-binding protein
MSGDLDMMYDMWFVQGIPPKNIRLGLAASDATKSAWANLNDRPVEAYAKK